MAGMTVQASPLRRYHTATGVAALGRSFVARPAQWRTALAWLRSTEGVELRVTPGLLADQGPVPETEVLIAAASLRDAGVALTLAGAGRAEHLPWLRRLPWSFVVAHPVLVAPVRPGDRGRIVASWAEATTRLGLHYVAPMDGAADLAMLRDQGFSHGEVVGAG